MFWDPVLEACGCLSNTGHTAFPRPAHEHHQSGNGASHGGATSGNLEDMRTALDKISAAGLQAAQVSGSISSLIMSCAHPSPGRAARRFPAPTVLHCGAQASKWCIAVGCRSLARSGCIASHYIQTSSFDRSSMAMAPSPPLLYQSSWHAGCVQPCLCRSAGSPSVCWGQVAHAAAQPPAGPLEQP